METTHLNAEQFQRAVTHMSNVIEQFERAIQNFMWAVERLEAVLQQDRESRKEFSK